MTRENLVTLAAVVLTNVCSGSRVCCDSNRRLFGCVAVELSLLPLKSTICYVSVRSASASHLQNRESGKEYQNSYLWFISSEFRTAERSGSVVDTSSDLERFGLRMSARGPTIQTNVFSWFEFLL